jgi:hypothetical protein
VTREPDSTDRRRTRIRVTDRGLAMLQEGETIFDELREQWEQQVGTASLSSLEETLRELLKRWRAASTRPGRLRYSLPVIQVLQARFRALSAHPRGRSGSRWRRRSAPGRCWTPIRCHAAQPGGVERDRARTIGNVVERLAALGDVGLEHRERAGPGECVHQPVFGG